MTSFFRIGRHAGILAIPLLLGCFPGGTGDLGPAGPPSPSPLAFQYMGPTQVVAGSYGDIWQIFTEPQVFGGNKLHFSGPGTLTDLFRNPLDLSLSNLQAQGYYVPPATVPAGGATVTLSMEAYWTPTQQWIQSPAYTIQVVPLAAPMAYEVDFGSPTVATLHQGESSGFTVKVTPRPLDIQQQVVLVPAQPTSSDLGTATSVWITPAEWGIHYVAPSIISVPMDITVRATAHDPWFNLDPHVDFTVHLVPN